MTSIEISLSIHFLDTCPPPDSYASPWELLNDFRLFTSHFGTVTSIKAYWDRNTLRNATADVASEALRAAMPAMGVSLVDCSLTQGYTTDALTRTLTGKTNSWTERASNIGLSY